MVNGSIAYFTYFIKGVILGWNNPLILTFYYLSGTSKYTFSETIRYRWYQAGSKIWFRAKSTTLDCGVQWIFSYFQPQSLREKWFPIWTNMFRLGGEIPPTRFWRICLHISPTLSSFVGEIDHTSNIWDTTNWMTFPMINVVSNMSRLEIAQRSLSSFHSLSCFFDNLLEWNRWKHEFTVQQASAIKHLKSYMELLFSIIILGNP